MLTVHSCFWDPKHLKQNSWKVIFLTAGKFSWIVSFFLINFGNLIFFFFQIKLDTTDGLPLKRIVNFFICFFFFLQDKIKTKKLKHRFAVRLNYQGAEKY